MQPVQQFTIGVGRSAEPDILQPICPKSLMKTWIAGGRRVSLLNVAEGYLCAGLALRCLEMARHSNPPKTALTNRGWEFWRIGRDILGQAKRDGIDQAVTERALSPETLMAAFMEELPDDVEPQSFVQAFFQGPLMDIQHAAIGWLSNDKKEAEVAWKRGVEALRDALGGKYADLEARTYENIFPLAGVKVYHIGDFFSVPTITNLMRYKAIYWALHLEKN